MFHIMICRVLHSQSVFIIRKRMVPKKPDPFVEKKKKPKNLYSIRFIIKTTNNKQIERNGIYFSFNHIFSYLFTKIFKVVSFFSILKLPTFLGVINIHILITKKVIN